jgi:DNA polymerase-1
MRSIFIPDPNYSFVDCDFTGQEVIIAGDFSLEPVLLKAFQEGFDHHSFLASISYSILFKQQVEIKNIEEYIEIDGFKYNVKKLRDVHKSCLFAKFYGGGMKRIMNILNEYLVNHHPPTEREGIAEQISRALNGALPVLTKFLKGKVNECKEQGYVVANKLGRRRYFDEPEKAYGEVMNLPIQATGADCIKISLIKIDEWLENTAKEMGIKQDELGWITMTIYDQNLVCFNDKYIDLSKKIPEIMADSITYFLKTLKGSSDYNIRKFWSK